MIERITFRDALSLAVHGSASGALPFRSRHGLCGSAAQVADPAPDPPDLGAVTLERRGQDPSALGPGEARGATQAIGQHGDVARPLAREIASVLPGTELLEVTSGAANPVTTAPGCARPSCPSSRSSRRDPDP